MRTQSSYSRHVPWADEEPGNLGEDQGPQRHLEAPPARLRNRRVRRHVRRHASMTLTAGLLLAVGLSAGSLMFSDRVADMLRARDWIEPSIGWLAFFRENGAIRKGPDAKVETAALKTPAPPPPPQHEPARQPEPEPVLVKAANNYPATTSSLGTAPAGPRDLAWLPEEKPESPAVETAPAPPQVAAVAPQPAAVAPQPAVVAPQPAPITLLNAAPAPSLPAEEVAELTKRARSHIDLGDISGARLLLERAASANDPSALMALAETYDPAMLAKWRARSVKADPGKARALYQKAAESGIAEARTRILALN